MATFRPSKFLTFVFRDGKLLEYNFPPKMTIADSDKAEQFDSIDEAIQFAAINGKTITETQLDEMLGYIIDGDVEAMKAQVLASGIVEGVEPIQEPVKPETQSPVWYKLPDPDQAWTGFFNAKLVEWKDQERFTFQDGETWLNVTPARAKELIAKLTEEFPDLETLKFEKVEA